MPYVPYPILYYTNYTIILGMYLVSIYFFIDCITSQFIGKACTSGEMPSLEEIKAFVQKYGAKSEVSLSIIITKSLLQNNSHMVSIPAIWTVCCRQTAMNMLSCENTAQKRRAFARVFTQLIFGA